MANTEHFEIVRQGTVSEFVAPCDKLKDRR